MKNFEVRCPVDGTSALQPEFERGVGRAATIIAFPGDPASTKPCMRDGNLSAAKARDRLMATDMAWSLKNGSVHGRSYDRVEPWQAIAAGIVFVSLSVCSLLVGL